MRISDWSSDVCSSDLERAPGDAIGAKPVEDRPVEARRGGDRGVGMERIIVAREAVDQRLLGPGCKFGALVRGRGRHLVRCTRGKRGPAAAAVAPQEGDLGYAGEQGAGCGVGNLARRIEEGALIGTLVYDMGDGELAADLALARKRGVEDDRSEKGGGGKEGVR